MFLATGHCKALIIINGLKEENSSFLDVAPNYTLGGLQFEFWGWMDFFPFFVPFSVSSCSVSYCRLSIMFKSVVLVC